MVENSFHVRWVSILIVFQEVIDRETMLSPFVCILVYLIDVYQIIPLSKNKREALILYG